MNSHRLILGETLDLITGKIVPDTLDERYRQKLARLLVDNLGYAKSEIESNRELLVRAGDQCAILKIDYIVTPTDVAGMIVRYGPGSLVTRRRPALAASRLVTSHQIPLVVVTNGEDAEVLEGPTGKVLSQGLETVPARRNLVEKIARMDTEPVSEAQKEMEARILYAFDVDDSCPCDDTVCRL